MQPDTTITTVAMTGPGNAIPLMAHLYAMHDALKLTICNIETNLLASLEIDADSARQLAAALLAHAAIVQAQNASKGGKA